MTRPVHRLAPPQGVLAKLKRATSVLLVAQRRQQLVNGQHAKGDEVSPDPSATFVALTANRIFNVRLRHQPASDQHFADTHRPPCACHCHGFLYPASGAKLVVK
jgi:hypothetical protein